MSEKQAGHAMSDFTGVCILFQQQQEAVGGSQNRCNIV